MEKIINILNTITDTMLIINKYIQKFDTIFMLLGLFVPCFIVIAFKIERIKKEKIVSKNINQAIKCKEIYNTFLNNDNFRNKKNNKLLNFLSLNNNHVLIIFAVVYFISAIFVIYTDYIIETAVANIVFNILFWFYKIISYFMIDVKNSTTEVFEKEIIPMYLKHFFPKYEFEPKGKLKRDNYKFYISKDSFLQNNRWYKYVIDSNEIELHDVSIYTKEKIKEYDGTRKDKSTIVFSGIYGVVKLNKTTNIRNIELSHKKTKRYKNRIKGLNYSVYSEDKHTLELLLTDELKQKLNKLRKEYKFDFYVENGDYFYFKVEDYNSFAVTAIDETDFIYNFIKTNEIFTEIENVIKEFLKYRF